MTKTITILVQDIMYNTGDREVIAVTPQQWAGKLRTKGFKKKILQKQEVATLTIKIKTK